MRARTAVRLAGLAFTLLVGGTVSGAAQVPMVGVFTAEASCFATPSIRSDDNPGRIVTEPGETYDLIGRNASPGSHYLIRVPGAEPDRRWVAFGCGRIGDPSSSAQRMDRPDPRSVPAAAPSRHTAKRDSYILAASWQPAFCETRPRVRECRSGGSAKQGFSLHGLWPQPKGREYCGVPADIRDIDERGDWRRLPDHDASAQTRRDLARVMPGAQSGLDRHEWWTHGTCHGGGADDYFTDSIRLIEELNASPVRTLFERSIGGTLTSERIRQAFDAAFGRGAGRRLLVDCASDANGQRMVQELRISLAGRLDGQASLRDLVLAGESVPAGCRAGRVDAPGFG